MAEINYTEKDLIDPTKFKLLANELLNFYGSIRKNTNFNYAKWSTKETRLYGYTNCSGSAKAMKQYHKEAYKKDRSQYLRLLSKCQYDSQENSVLGKLKAKAYYLTIRPILEV